MTTGTTNAIKSFSKDIERADSLLALMDYYGVDSLMKISEQQGLYFLGKLKRGEVIIDEEGIDWYD